MVLPGVPGGRVGSCRVFFIFTKNRPDESPAFFLSEKHPASPGSDHRPPMALAPKRRVGLRNACTARGAWWESRKLPGFFIFTKNRPDESPAFFLSEKHPASPGSDHRPPMALAPKRRVGLRNACTARGAWWESRKLPGFFIFTKNRPDESPAFFFYHFTRQILLSSSRTPKGPSASGVP